MASAPQKNLQFISPSKETGDFLQNQVKFYYTIFMSLHLCPCENRQAGQNRRNLSYLHVPYHGIK